MGTRFRLRLDPQLATDPARLSQKFKPSPTDDIVRRKLLLPPSVQADCHYPDRHFCFHRTCSLGQVGFPLPRLRSADKPCLHLRRGANFVHYWPARSKSGPMSSFIPGPIVDEIEIFLIYVPFAPGGFALFTASTRLQMFSAISPSAKLALPTPT